MSVLPAPPSIIDLEYIILKLQRELEELKKNQKKVYAIGQYVRNVVAGHGDYYNERQIRPLGMYGQDGFAPVFLTEEAAVRYRDNMKYASDYEVYELDLIEE